MENKTQEQIKSTDELKGIKEVRLKADKRIYTIYSIYNKSELSLCLYGYADVEQDFLTNINEIEVLK